MGLRYKDIFKGFKYNLLIGLICFFSISLAKDNWVLNFITQIVIPVFLAYSLTQRLFFAIILVTINDVYLMFGSLFFAAIGIPMPRSILLLITITITTVIVMQNTKIFSRNLNMVKASKWVVFYSIIFPLYLVVIAFFLDNTTIMNAFKDIFFLFPLLMFFPLSILIKNHLGVFLGWLVAISVLQALISLIISLGPKSVAITLYQNYSNIAVDVSQINHFLNSVSFIRNASPAFIISLVGFFGAIAFAIDKNKRNKYRFLGVFFAALSISHILIDGLRGPVFASFFVLLLFVILILFKKRRKSESIRLFSLFVLFITLGWFTMTQFVPELSERFLLIFGRLGSFLGIERIEQNDEMIKSFIENPMFGRGVGAALQSGYSRAISGIDFELQYQMFLYKLGLMNFVIIMFPIIWILYEAFRKGSILQSDLFKIEEKFQMALLLGIIANCIASYTNPYLKTGYLTLTFAIYFAVKTRQRAIRNE